jgi:hypothetical protein
LSLFKDRFLASEEGAITKEHVLFEIKLMQAEDEAKTGECAQAQSLVTGDLAMPGSSRSSQEYFRMAQVERTCRNTQQSNALWRKAAAGESYADLPWRMEAEKLLGTYNADRSTERLLKSLPGAEHLMEIGSYSSLRWYTIGVTQAALHQGTAARESFRKSLLLPDSFMSHHLTRAALAGFQP